MKLIAQVTKKARNEARLKKTKANGVVTPATASPIHPMKRTKTVSARPKRNTPRNGTTLTAIPQKMSPPKPKPPPSSRANLQHGRREVAATAATVTRTRLHVAPTQTAVTQPPAGVRRIVKTAAGAGRGMTGAVIGSRSEEERGMPGGGARTGRPGTGIPNGNARGSENVTGIRRGSENVSGKRNGKWSENVNRNEKWNGNVNKNEKWSGNVNRSAKWSGNANRNAKWNGNVNRSEKLSGNVNRNAKWNGNVKRSLNESWRGREGRHRKGRLIETEEIVVIEGTNATRETCEVEQIRETDGIEETHGMEEMREIGKVARVEKSRVTEEILAIEEVIETEGREIEIMAVGLEITVPEAERAAPGTIRIVSRVQGIGTGAHRALDDSGGDRTEQAAGTGRTRAP